MSFSPNSGEEIHCRHLIATGEQKVTLFLGGSKHNAVILWIEISRLLFLG